jgi:hypothetical protein
MLSPGPVRMGRLEPYSPRNCVGVPEQRPNERALERRLRRRKPFGSVYTFDYAGRSRIVSPLKKKGLHPT